MTEILCCRALKKLEGSTADVDLVNLDRCEIRASQSQIATRFCESAIQYQQLSGKLRINFFVSIELFSSSLP